MIRTIMSRKRRWRIMMLQEDEVEDGDAEDDEFKGEEDSMLMLRRR